MKTEPTSLDAVAAPESSRLFSERVAVIGNPVDVPTFSAASLKALRDRGFTEIQLNIAWLSRPHDEPLNLRDVVSLRGETVARAADRLSELQRRCSLARDAGLRTLFHVGTPYMWRDPATGESIPAGGRGVSHFADAERDPTGRFDTGNPAVVEYELALLERLREACPDLDDLLVYTYDQDAWQASEFGPSPFSRGIPLHVRLPRYLHAIHEVWTAHSGSRLWWEPWELSAGQVLACIPALPRQNFGLCLHSNIAEVQLVDAVDSWLRLTTRLAHERQVPVWVEAFLGSANEEIEPLSLPTPRLVDEQVRRIAQLTGVTGIKEYFGINTSEPDINLDVVTERLRRPSAQLEDILDDVLPNYSDQPNFRTALAHLDEAYAHIPWDATWFARLIGGHGTAHGWDAAFIRGHITSTPSWDSTRRGHFMSTDDERASHYLLEDIQLRFHAAAARFDSAVALLDTVIAQCDDSSERAFCEDVRSSATKLAAITRAYALHLRETMTTRLLREDRADGRARNGALLSELLALLEADVANQEGAADATAALDLARSDIDAFLDTYFLDTEETPPNDRPHRVTTRRDPKAGPREEYTAP